MPKLANYKECTGCMACIDACPTNALDFSFDPEEHYTISINEQACVSCGICEKTCPVLNKPEQTSLKNSTPYVAWSPNDEIRLKSTSGGAFAECALAVLAQNGVVIGAAINGKQVEHIVINNNSDLHKLQKSKYIQSKTKGIYRKSYLLLKEGKTVFFSGTPCQVAGLKNYLINKLFSGDLITGQVVCHGVPSNFIINLLEKFENTRINKIEYFRSKYFGWKNSYTFSFIDNDNNLIVSQGDENNFIKMYGTNFFLRRCCYNCKFISILGVADISFADYWGNISHTNEHDKGLSLVITHGKTGKQLLNSSQLLYYPTSWDEALPENPRIYNGKNYLLYHPARFLLKFHINNLSKNYLKKIYTNNIKKNNFLLFPYKLINKLLHITNNNINHISLKKILTKCKFFKKSIALLTFHSAKNYGAVLQTYALCKFLEKNNFNVNIINLRPKEISGTLTLNPMSWVTYVKFNGFEKQFFKFLPNNYNSKNDLHYNPPKADYYIVGSDQVWNDEITKDFKYNYFFDFITQEAKLISYAASFGRTDVTFDDQEKNTLKYLLTRFHAISVRENSAISILKNNFGIDSKLVLDPTLLLYDFSSLIRKVKNNNDLVAFKFNKDDYFYKMLNQIGKELNLPITILDSTHPKRGMSIIPKPSVQLWIETLNNSSFVVTDSFHGVAFCIIFKKDFIVTPCNISRFTRIENLLKLLKLEDRIYYNYDDVLNSNKWKKNIDYEAVNEQLFKYRDISSKFLLESLQ